MIFARFLAPLALILCLVAYLLLPWTDHLFINWSKSDLETRSRLIFSSVEDDVLDELNAKHPERLTKRLTELAADERLVGIGFCDKAGTPKYRNEDFPPSIGCPAPETVTAPEFSNRVIKGGPVLVAVFPVTAADTVDTATETAAQPASTPVQSATSVPPAVIGNVIVVHDMSFAVRRSQQTRYYVLAFVLTISLLAAFITLIFARLTFSRWLTGLRDYVRTGKRSTSLPREAIGITRDIQQRIRKIEREQQRPILAGEHWSAEALYQFVKNHLPSEQLITVSYRQPYAHSKTSKGFEYSTPASGLVTAIEPIMKACRGTWVAVGTSEADRESADAGGGIMVPPDNPAYRLRRLWLSAEEEAGFYAGFANEGVWPLCNMVYVKPRFRTSDWEMYQKVNQKFADVIASEAKSDAPIIFIQDYHFGLLPKLLREKFPNALIIIFWHIPWPNSETFGILPWRNEFLEGMLAADIVGFHTQFHCNNFLDCVDTHVEALIDREHDTVRRGDDLCMVRPYPISIAWPDFGSIAVPVASDCRKELIAKLKLRDDEKIILGVERLDYIKGIPERLRAFGTFLERNSDWIGKVAFVQVASPSRSIIPAYADIGNEVEAVAEEVNKKYGRGGWQPIHLLKQNFNQSDVYKFYRACDVCIVSSLHDGMNLVAKEFIAAREDERGSLILSQFAGSSRELVDALIVNPYDEEGLAQSMLRGLTMGEVEQQARIRSMREYVKSHNVFAWAAKILGDASNLHRRRQLNNMLLNMEPVATNSDEAEIRPEAAE